MQNIRVTKDVDGMRLDRFLFRILPAAPESLIYRMLRKKNITLNGKKATGSEKIRGGDNVEMFFAQETYENFTGEGEDIEKYCRECLEAYNTLPPRKMIYADPHVLIVDKPEGVLSQRTTSSEATMNEFLTGYLLNKGKITPDTLKLQRPSVCNRLDRNTSGLLIFGITRLGLTVMNRLIQERTIKKTYEAIVFGRPEKTGLQEAFLKKDEDTNTVEISDTPKKGFSPIKTKISVEKELGDFTLLELELITGKPHQLRAHLAALGTPIVGDPKYGEAKFFRWSRDLGIERQLLHASSLTFPEIPEEDLSGLSGETISCKLPEEMRKFAKHFS